MAPEAPVLAVSAAWPMRMALVLDEKVSRIIVHPGTRHLRRHCSKSLMAIISTDQRHISRTNSTPSRKLFHLHRLQCGRPCGERFSQRGEIIFVIPCTKNPNRSFSLAIVPEMQAECVDSLRTSSGSGLDSEVGPGMQAPSKTSSDPRHFRQVQKSGGYIFRRSQPQLPSDIAKPSRM